MQMRISHLSTNSHGTFAFCRFFCQDVAFESLLMRNFSGAGYLKPFFGAGVCFYLWHVI